MLVITALAVIGAVTYLLADGAKTMLFESDTAYLEACRRNLVASGLTWSRENVAAGQEVGRSFELDVSEMGIRDARLEVTISAIEADAARVEVAVSCSRARRTADYQREHTVGLR